MVSNNLKEVIMTYKPFGKTSSCHSGLGDVFQFVRFTKVRKGDQVLGELWFVYNYGVNDEVKDYGYGDPISLPGSCKFYFELPKRGMGSSTISLAHGLNLLGIETEIEQGFRHKKGEVIVKGVK
tara:strand:+ start:232 stop:603 length:372 start_codon:yes stop_codon:yes gene_type:complete